MAGSADRDHAMDALRALAMLAGVVFHAALAYSPLMHDVWPAADAGGSRLVDVGAWFLHLFRMPLFFAIAGYFAAATTARRGLGGLFRHRLVRIGGPLLVLAPLLQAVMGWLTVRAARNVLQPPPALAWLRDYLGEHGALPFAPGWAHLWFLFYLLLFLVLAWVAAMLVPVAVPRRLARLPLPAWLGGLPLLLALPLLLVGAPWPAPERLLPALWAMLYFGAYFAGGWGLWQAPDLLPRLRPWAPWLLAGALAAYALLFVTSDGFADHAPRPLHAWLQAAAGLWMTLWCLLAANRWLDTANPAMRWLADAGYWVYLLHLPVLLAIQYALLDVAWPWPLEFALATTATLALCLLSFHLRNRGRSRLSRRRRTTLADEPGPA